MELNVAIIGAGPAGCTLALPLLKAHPNIKVTLFEAESNAHSRNQGGTLDLHSSTGLRALKRIGLYDEFTRKARYDGEALIVADKHMKRYVNVPGANRFTSYGRPEIDRVVLRDMLLAAIPDANIKWAHKLRRVEDHDRRLTLHFDCGASYADFDIVAGADGTWSRVRPLLTPVKPAYSGVAGIRISVSDVKEKHPDLHALVLSLIHISEPTRPY